MSSRNQMSMKLIRAVVSRPSLKSPAGALRLTALCVPPRPPSPKQQQKPVNVARDEEVEDHAGDGSGEGNRA